MGILKKKRRKISKLPELAATESVRTKGKKSCDDSFASSSGRKSRESGDDDTLAVPAETASDDCADDERVENSAEQKEFATKLEQANNGFARAMLYIAKAFLHGDCGCPGQDTTEAKKWCQKIVRSRVIKDEDLKDEAREILKQINSAGSIEIADSNDDAEVESNVQDSSQPVDYGALSNEELELLADSGDSTAQNKLGDVFLSENKDQEALKWFEKAAESANPLCVAALKAAQLCEDGRASRSGCVEYSDKWEKIVDAQHFYKIAARLGDAYAKEKVSHLKERLHKHYESIHRRRGWA